MHPVEVEVAQLLTEMFPCAEMVAFGKNGSDARYRGGPASRARPRAGRSILQYGVHGFHDWSRACHPACRAFRKLLRALVQPFPYNDLGALAALFEALCRASRARS